MIHYDNERVTLHHGDCLEVLRGLPDASVHAVVTDPPYNLSFMGKAWDDHSTAVGFQAWCEAWARECLRVLTPGGHLLAFGGTRTAHRLASGIEDAGFEVRDSIAWLYGSGFPKSLDVSKAIDRARDDRDDVLALTTALADLAEAAGITRSQLDERMGTSDMGGWWLSRLRHRCACPSVDNWTRLRDLIPGAPALDDLVWRLNGRKGSPGEAWAQREVLGRTVTPFKVDEAVKRASSYNPTGSTITADGYRYTEHTAPATPDAARWQGWGTALKPAHEPIVVARKPLTVTVAATVLAHGTGALNIDGARVAGDVPSVPEPKFSNGRDDLPGHSDGRIGVMSSAPGGRWPANVLLDGTQADALDEESGVSSSTKGGVRASANAMWGRPAHVNDGSSEYDDEGGASRFFPVFRWQAKAPTDERPRAAGVAHPTVKPLDLMRWLVRLVTPPGGTVLEPFAGSGTTVEACLLEGFRCVAIEREATYLPLIVERIHRQLDPVAYHQGEAADDPDHDPGLFGLLGDDAA